MSSGNIVSKERFLKLACEECGATTDLYNLTHLSEKEDYRTTFLLCLKHVQEFKGVDEQ